MNSPETSTHAVAVEVSHKWGSPCFAVSCIVAAWAQPLEGDSHAAVVSAHMGSAPQGDSHASVRSCLLFSACMGSTL